MTAQDTLLADLFEKARPLCLDGQDTYEGVLDAVASRRKAMEWQAWPAAAIDECWSDYIEFLDMARARKLTVVQLPGPTGKIVAVYALYPENLWRALAHEAFSDRFSMCREWSRAAEMLQSHLLGYADEGWPAWEAHNEWRNAGWFGPTIYFLMNRACQERIDALAARCIDPVLADHNLVAVLAGWDRVVKRDGFTRLPPDTALARAAFPHAFVDTLFGPAASRPAERIPTRVLDRDLLDALNHELIDRLQFLTAEGWR
jgi:hypothetical protein